jgi:hypothetical protein
MKMASSAAASIAAREDATAPPLNMVRPEVEGMLLSASCSPLRFHTAPEADMD